MKKKYLLLLLSMICMTMLFAISAGVLAVTSPLVDNSEEAADYSVGLGSIGPESGITPSATDGNLIVVIDPGHGYQDSAGTSQGPVYEGIMNLEVANGMKEYLESHYTNVTVYMTRYDNNTKSPSLQERGQIAANHGADIMISCHFDGGPGSGGMVIISRLEEYALTDLGLNISQNLGNLGIHMRYDRGLWTRASGNGTMWIDGLRIADYYGAIKWPITHEIPSMIIEHCFANESYANTAAKRKALGEADARAIATTYNLDESISATTLENARYVALQQLNDYFNTIYVPNRYLGNSEVGYYSEALRAVAIYEDAVERISIATGTGKINLTLNRALKTVKNYPGVTTDNTTGLFDVKATDWFASKVQYCIDNNIFYGTTDRTFSPYAPITRGQFIAVLGRYAGADNTKPALTPFVDVDGNAYYAAYVKWGVESSITKGTSDITFSPDNSIRRQDLITMLYAYTTEAGLTVTGSGDKAFSSFNDGATVSAYALPAMTWAIEKGIIKGDEKGNLNPMGETTRAETAQIFKVFSEKTK